MEKTSEWRIQKAIAESIAVKWGVPVRRELPDGRLIELQRLEDGRPVFYTTNNLAAAATISTDKVWPGGSGGFTLTGSGVTLGIWDVGLIRSTHQELAGRVQKVDTTLALNNHSTHVAGTMIASGVTASAKGMSYQGNLKAYDWNNDLAEMASAGSSGIPVSNHSYGLISGWTNNYFGDGKWVWTGSIAINASEDYNFGYYGYQARELDKIAYNAPYYTMVKSAGNDRGEPGPTPGTQHWDYVSGSWTLATDTHEPDGGTDGYDCLSDYAVSKNSLAVGAVNDIPSGYSGPTSVVMSTFSSWGPTDDGRMKPDVVANGVGLYSSVATADNAYASYSGTSMASPSVTGSIGLLLQHQKNLHGDLPLRSSTVRGLVIHTADEAGPNAGPDYMFGWGLMNTLKAVQVMTKNSQNGGQFNIREVTLIQGGQIEFQVEATGVEPLRATIAWTDPAGTSPSPSLNPTTRMLVNDLDLRLVGPDATTFLPYTLDPANPSVAAVAGDNIRDNVEQIHIQNPIAGMYTVRVTHKGSLAPAGSQIVSVIITGANPPAATPPTTPTLVAPTDGATGVISSPTLAWNSSTGASSYRLQLSTLSNFSTTVLDSSEISGFSLTISGLQSTTQYYWRVSAINSAGASNFSTAWSFTTGIPPPGVPVLFSPSDGATGVATNSSLVWYRSAGATSYQVQVSASQAFSTTILNQTGITDSSIAVLGLSGNTLYYWRVNASNAGGPSAYSTPRSFTTVATPPPAPTLVAPINGGTDVPTSTSLNWNPSLGAVAYRVQVSADPGFASLVKNDSVTTATSSLNGLVNSTTYYWRVNASNSQGVSGFSEVWSFLTAVAPPPVPTLVSPANGATVYTSSQKLTWNRVSTAASYRLLGSSRSNFTQILFDENDVSDTSFTEIGLSGTVYWKVSASNAGGSSAFSASRSFTVSAPSTPAPVSPANGAAGVPNPPTLMWNLVQGASTFQVQVATASNFNNVVLNQTGIADTSFVAQGLSYNTQYYWHVKATSDVGSSSYSSNQRNFTTVLAAPIALTASTVSASGFTANWNSVSGASSYRLDVAVDTAFSAILSSYNNLSVTATSKVVSGLTANTLYCYRVRAVNTGGTGANSNIVSVATFASGTSTISLTSGNGQSATINTTLSSPFIVTVRDSSGNPKQAVSVTFAVSSTPTNSIGQSLSATTTSTDVSGNASTTLTLGNKTGAYTVTATSSGVSGSPVTFSATATAGSATSLSVYSGNNQSAAVNSQLSQPLTVLVADAGGNPVQGIDVAFAFGTVPSGSSNHGLGDTLVTTNSNGRAATTVTLGAKSGVYEVIASSSGLTGSPLTFIETGTTGNAAAMSGLSGDAQTGIVGKTLQNPFVVAVTDSSGNTVSGVGLTFAIVGSPSGSTGQSLSSTNTTTSSNGQASSLLTLGSKTGSYSISATSTGLTGSPVFFVATAASGTAYSLSKTSGDAQSGNINSTLMLPFVVTVRDTFANPVQNTSVTFAIGSVPAGATGQSLNATNSTTGSDGRASSTLTLGNKSGLYTVTVASTGLLGSPLSFTATANSTSSAEDIQSVPKEFDLLQNYPNPFNPSTSITYHVPSVSRIRLEVFNVLGQSVALLVDADHLPGRYTISWHPEISTGSFFCVMTYSQADGRTAAVVKVRKLLVMR